ncbi:alpha/beta-hydrolase [Mycena albidolilacea]|uniref:carboxypeptidase C n=1 Tax=Mycena albidolilacea TaxID=1033008 RepID=A0AAD7AQ22_9AGAR|nr:alpha/beta-hydrolase [Mycena albidolilacea]
MNAGFQMRAPRAGVKSPLLPQRQFLLERPSRKNRSSWAPTRWLVVGSLVLTWVLYSWRNWNTAQSKADLFYSNVTSPTHLCSSPQGPTVSHAGYIGLKGDSETVPKRSFFWYFEAEHDAERAPIILTIGGGPGSSGMINLLSAQGPCLIIENGTVPNPDRWTEHFNLIALDHPVGAGASYGIQVNNSRSAAIDVYDFLQKFFLLFPDVAQNPLILSGGSYGGVYVPHIATVIHEQNIALAKGEGLPAAAHINLESMMVSNPMSDATSHFTWLLQTRCYNADMYNASTCAEMFEILPTCLESIQFAQQAPEWSVERRVAAQNICQKLEKGDTHGTVVEDVRKKCYSKEPMGCFPPSFNWINDFFRRPENKDALGIPENVNYHTFADDVTAEFRSYGDMIQPSYLLYGPLLKAGIRLLHYVGAQDANCAWPGVISFLRLLQSPFQDEFLRAPDVPWPTSEDTTVRVVGEGAGNMTYILVAGGGHFVAKDQPTLVKSIVEHWVHNVPFV